METNKFKYFKEKILPIYQRKLKEDIKEIKIIQENAQSNFFAIIKFLFDTNISITDNVFEFIVPEDSEIICHIYENPCEYILRKVIATRNTITLELYNSDVCASTHCDITQTLDIDYICLLQILLNYLENNYR